MTFDEQTVLSHPLVVVQLRQIALAGVAQQADDQGVRVVDFASQCHRHMHDQAGRTSDEQTFLPGQTPRHVEGIAILDRAKLIDEAEVECAGQLVVAGTLHFVGRVPADLPGLEVVSVDRTPRVRADDFDLGVPLFKEAGDARHRTPGSRRPDEVCDPSLGLGPDLGARRPVMGFRVRIVVELIRHDRVGRFLDDPPGDVQIVVRMIGRHG